MSVRHVVLEQIEDVARQQRIVLAPLADETKLLESGLDSLSIAIVVARLEDELDIDPFLDEQAAFPVTIGEFVRLYDRANA